MADLGQSATSINDQADHNNPGNRVALHISMHCPLCHVALKSTGYRGVAVDYCSLCGGTWIGAEAFTHLSWAAMAHSHSHRRNSRAFFLAAVIVTVGLLGAVVTGAVKFWPVAVNLVERQTSTADISTRTPPTASAGFQRLLSTVAAVPDLGPLIRTGAYVEVLQEASRQNVNNLKDLNPADIVSPELRAVAVQIQQLLQTAPDASASVVDPALLEFLKSEAFRNVSRNPALERFLGPSGRRAPPL